MNIENERKLFEQLPLAELAIKSEYVYYDEKSNSYFPNEDFCPDSAPETMNFAWQAWQASVNREGFVLVANNRKTIVAIEQMVEQQVEASGMDSKGLERLDGWRIMDVIIEASQENKDE